MALECGWRVPRKIGGGTEVFSIENTAEKDELRHRSDTTVATTLMVREAVGVAGEWFSFRWGKAVICKLFHCQPSDWASFINLEIWEIGPVVPFVE